MGGYRVIEAQSLSWWYMRTYGLLCVHSTKTTVDTSDFELGLSNRAARSDQDKTNIPVLELNKKGQPWALGALPEFGTGDYVPSINAGSGVTSSQAKPLAKVAMLPENKNPAFSIPFASNRSHRRRAHLRWPAAAHFFQQLQSRTQLTRLEERHGTHLQLDEPT